ncbi:hypothetical protein ACP275_09G041900 [Erythranthe tilingii]
MNNPPNEVMEQIEENVQFPEWVSSFLAETFFEKCGNHGENQKNEVNRYCITCNETSCRYCVASGHHKDHYVLTIYRHVYQNVVPLTPMEAHINCDGIQPYKCNKKWVISLTPLPHNGSGSLMEGGGACLVCKRKLTDSSSYQFCSIACKVSASRGEVEVPEAGEGSSAMQEDNEEPGNGQGRRRRRSRKGVPHRAPFSANTPIV